MHEYPLRLTWHGTTAGPAEHTRDAVASTGRKPDIPVSAGSAFLGDDTRWNPEDLFGASLATCHMLTFLSLVKKVKVDVRHYADDVSVRIESVEGVTRVTRVRLAPTITIAPGGDVEKTRMMFVKAHKYCFIGNSTTAEVVMEPTIVVEGGTT
ncbi:OsmC family protein [Sandaracinus amylolyticus]|uniref:OsmC/Ohr family protein n=1 Tax=Sandaracinus amylolyticus TaxID=927083 RepID=A0A0F6W9M3_9BACT|nr:OsmC family protein [Sandaracinus amylolyticus]AKF10917.1 OsmC/Ohr family protein [Sandaracinus amylolyticus]